MIHPADTAHPDAAPVALRARRCLRVAAHVLRMSMHAITLAAPHRLMPGRVDARGLGFVMASLIYLASGWLRDGVLGHLPGAGALLLHAASYGVLLLISWPRRLPEFLLFLCASIGGHLVGAVLLLATGPGPEARAALNALQLWQYAAMLVAMVQWRLAGGSRGTNRP